MKLRFCSALLLCFLVEECWSQRSRDRPPQHRPQKQPQPQPSDDGELTDECPEPNGFFADGYQCDKYYECKDGAITEKLCPDGMVFNDYSTLYEKCDLPFNIDCSQRSQLQDPKPTTHCPRQNGYFAHEDVKICDKFYFCVDGKFNMITCPAGLVYNEKTGICTWPDEAKKKHCSSEVGEGYRTKRVAIWKSEEEASNEFNNSGEIHDDLSEENESSPPKSSSEYASNGSSEYSDYPEELPHSGEGDYFYYEAPTPNLADTEFSQFDAEFNDFADEFSYPGFGAEDFVRRKKDSYDGLDDYIKGYVTTIGQTPEKASTGIRVKHYENVAEDERKEDAEDEHDKTTDSTKKQRSKAQHVHNKIRPVHKSHKSRDNAPTQILAPIPVPRHQTLVAVGHKHPTDGLVLRQMPKPPINLPPVPTFETWRSASPFPQSIPFPRHFPVTSPSFTGFQIRMPQSG